MSFKKEKRTTFNDSSNNDLKGLGTTKVTRGKFNDSANTEKRVKNNFIKKQSN